MTDRRTHGETRNCKGCRYWSEMVAQSIGGGPVQNGSWAETEARAGGDALSFNVGAKRAAALTVANGAVPLRLRLNAGLGISGGQPERSMKWEELSQKTRDVMVELGNFGPTVNVEDRMLKGWTHDGESGGKCYWTSADAREIASALQESAEWLDKRADMDAPPRFVRVSCSQCGRGFGPGSAGYSHCADHAGVAVTDA